MYQVGECGIELLLLATCSECFSLCNSWEIHSSSCWSWGGCPLLHQGVAEGRTGTVHWCLLPTWGKVSLTWGCRKEQQRGGTAGWNSRLDCSASPRGGCSHSSASAKDILHLGPQLWGRNPPCCGIWVSRSCQLCSLRMDTLTPFNLCCWGEDWSVHLSPCGVSASPALHLCSYMDVRSVDS